MQQIFYEHPLTFCRRTAALQLFNPLPGANVSDVLEGKLDALGSRMGRLLFKLAVEQSMTANILASEINAGLFLFS